MKIILIILILLNLSFEILSQNLSWREMNEYDVGMILTILKNDKGYILAGTSKRGLLRTTDNSLTWDFITNGLPDLSITKLTLLVDGRIFACTAGKGIYYSTDDGLSWFPFLNELSNQNLTQFLVHQSGYFYAGSYNGEGGLWRSKNLGLSWEEIDSSFEGKNINSLVINSKGHIFTSVNKNMIYRSTDFGNTWIKILSAKPDSQITSLCVTKCDDVLAGTRKDGTYIIKNNSDSLIFLNNTLKYSIVDEMVMRKDGEIYAATEDGSYILDSINNIWIEDFAYNDFTAIYFSNDNHDYIGSRYGVIYIRNDITNNWTPIYYNDHPYGLITSFIVLKSGELVAGTESNCLFFLSNQRIYWEYRCKGLKRNIIKTLYESNDGRLFSVLDTFGVFVSKDTCKNWNQINTGLENRTVKSFQSIQNSDVLAGTNNGIYVIHSGDTVWSETSSGLKDKNINCILKTSYNQIFAGTEQGNVYKSFNNGQTWVETGKLFKNDKPITNLVINSKGILFAGTLGKGINRSRDNGATWQTVNFGIMDYNINSIVVTKEDDLIASTPTSTYYSSVNGDAWIKNPEENLTSLVFYNGKLYAHNSNYIYISDSIKRTLNKYAGFWIDKGDYKENSINVGAITYIKYSLDGKSLYSFGEDKIFRKWDVGTGRIIEEHPYFDKERITDIDLDEKRNILGIAHQKDNNGYLDLYNLNYDTLIYSINLKYDHKEMGLYGDEFFTPKIKFNILDDKLYTGVGINAFYGDFSDYIGRFDSWELLTGKHIKNYEQLNFIPNQIIFSPDYNTMFYFGYSDGWFKFDDDIYLKHFYFYDIEKNDSIYNLNNRINKLAISPNQKYFAASTDSTNDIYLYDYKTFQIIKSWSNGYIHENYCPNSLKFSKDGNYLISSSTVSGYSKYKYKPTLDYIRIWRTETGQLIDSITFQSGLNLQLDISPDSFSIAAAGTDGLIKIIKPKIFTQKLKSFFVPDSTAKFIGSTIYLRDSSIGKPVSWFWNFGDGSKSSEQNPSHLYLDTGTYDITFITSDGIYRDTLIKKQYIHISPLLIADFDADPSMGVFPLTVQFSNKSIGDIKYYEWYLPGQSVKEKNTNYKFSNPGNYVIALEVYDGFFVKIKSKEISVLREPYIYPMIFEKDYDNSIMDEGVNAIESFENKLIISGLSKNYINSYGDKIIESTLVYCLDSNGNYLWSRRLEYGERITQLSDSNYLLIGNPTKLPNGPLTMIIKISQHGNLLWMKPITNPDSMYITGITPLKNEFIVAGYNNNGANSTFVTKYDNNGKQIWTKIIRGAGGILLDTSNNCYTFVIYYYMNDKFSIIKTDSEINITNAYNFEVQGHLDAKSFILRKNGNLIFVGSGLGGNIFMLDSNCKLLWKTLDTTYNELYSVVGLNDSLFAVTGIYLPCFTILNDSGKIINEIRFTGRQGYFNHINVTKNKELILTGKIFNTDYYTNIYFVKTIPYDLLLGLNNYKDNKEDLSLSVYPNPANGLFIVNYYLEHDSRVIIKLFNNFGVEVEKLINEYQGAGNHSIVCQNDLSDLSSGVYYLQLSANEKTTMTKILITR